MTGFDFQTANRILFGSGTFKELPKIASEFGKRVLLICSSHRKVGAELQNRLEERDIVVATFHVGGEPTLERVMEGVKIARDIDAQFVIGLGGGSVLDTAKAVAALAANPGDIFDYLEVIGKARPLAADPLPVLAVPTTAGTGSEVTRNAVLGVKAEGIKVSLRSPKMLPEVAMVDPLLTVGLPPDLTASTGMDALTQLIEPYVSIRANPMVDLFCEAGIVRAARSLKAAYMNGNNISAREDMAFASLLGGLALANAGLGAVHGCAAVIGGMYDAPHGAVCARLLPFVCDLNYRAITKNDKQSLYHDRYRQIAVWLTNRNDAQPEDGIAWLMRLIADLKIPGLATYGIGSSDIPVIVERAQKASSMKANPIQLTGDQLMDLVNFAL
jgi:alcohol dehydrogenase class IV